MNRIKLEIVRKKIDLVDKQLLTIIGKRTALVKKVIKIKKSRKEIIDKKRINDVLAKVKKHSIKKKIDTDITNNIWKTMIKSYIDYEKKKFK